VTLGFSLAPEPFSEAFFGILSQNGQAHFRFTLPHPLPRFQAQGCTPRQYHNGPPITTFPEMATKNLFWSDFFFFDVLGYSNLGVFPLETFAPSFQYIEFFFFGPIFPSIPSFSLPVPALPRQATSIFGFTHKKPEKGLFFRGNFPVQPSGLCFFGSAGKLGGSPPAAPCPRIPWLLPGFFPPPPPWLSFGFLLGFFPFWLSLSSQLRQRVTSQLRPLFRLWTFRQKPLWEW